jgi:hypothetical protein
MVGLLARLKLPRDWLGFAFVVFRTVLIIETAVTSVFSYLAAVAVQNVKCAGMHMIAGYRSELLDFWALPCMSLIAIVLVTSRANKARIIAAINYYKAYPEMAPKGVDAKTAIYCGIAVFIAAFGCAAIVAVARYGALAHYCGSATTLH